MADQSRLAPQFDDLEQQEDAAAFGMWVFIATEILFFGGLFLAYGIYRATYPDAFAAAGRELNLTIGTLNTALLLTSSYLMALAVHFAKTDRPRGCWRLLAGTWCLGLTFLALKAYEYYDDVERHIVPGAGGWLPKGYGGPHPEAARLLYFIYYAMTGLHAMHMTVGLVAIAVIFTRARHREFSSRYHAPVEVTGLYWHFVDLIWVFLYPLLYLMDRHP